MGGQLPTRGIPLTVEEDFGGVNQILGNTLLPPGVVRWSFGLIDTVQKHLRRLGGCLPLMDSSCSSCSSFSIISIGQLSFQSIEGVILHQSSGRMFVPCDDILISSAYLVDGVSEYGIG